MYKMRRIRQINKQFARFCRILSKLEFRHFGGLFDEKVNQY